MAKKAATDTATKAAPLDVASLATSVREDKMLAGAARKYNPFVEILRESYIADDAGENGTRAIDVTGAQVGEAVKILRNAGEQLAEEGIGIRLRFAFQNDEGRLVEIGDVKRVPTGDVPVTVKFLGRPRKVYLTDEQRNDAISRGFTIEVPVVENGQPVLDENGQQKVDVRPDTAAYLKWLDEEDQANESDVAGDEYNGG